jgi:xanthine dehydrogenase accessory factor
VVFGAGHIGTALAPMAMAAGFSVTVVDDRPGFPDPRSFPEGVRLVSAGYGEAMEGVRFSERSCYVVVVTHAHEKDTEVMDACLEKPWRYLGMIGSKAKVARVVKTLATGPERRERLERVRAPIGLALGGRSPGEIAVSILAELVMVKHGREQVAPLRILGGNH